MTADERTPIAMVSRRSGPDDRPPLAAHDARVDGLIVRRTDPLNCETDLSTLAEGVDAPNARFFIRTHFPVPAIDPAQFRLAVNGLVDRPLSLSLGDLRGLRAQTMIVTLECAGNGRTLFQPPAAGEPWTLGAVGTAAWTGVPLIDVLSRAGVRAEAREMLFRGADEGAIENGHPGEGTHGRFERSLPIDQLDRDLLLVYEMNGQPLSRERGAPLRLVVPGWYGMASVKWLTEIALIAAPFSGPFQRDRYCYEWERSGAVVREPVTHQQVRALIIAPVAGQTIARGPLTMSGLAWSGVAPIARVEVRVNDEDWQRAELHPSPGPHAWHPWTFTLDLSAPGRYTLSARATDITGRTQPARAEWNRGGYGNNSIQQITIDIA